MIAPSNLTRPRPLPRPLPLTRRHFGVSLVSLALLALAPAAIGQANVSRSTAVRSELVELLDSMERAVLAAEIEDYLAHIDPDRKSNV